MEIMSLTYNLTFTHVYGQFTANKTLRFKRIDKAREESKRFFSIDTVQLITCLILCNSFEFIIIYK